ncbi:MAG: endonuclease III [Candidatus Bathyarchaeia archaeon]|nr:endonuclease III [Candidatus Bathyarchaeota archaeon]
MVKKKSKTALDEISKQASSDPFKVLISTILSHRTRDESTKKAAESLFSIYSNALSLSKASVKEIRKLIKSVGFYRVKSKRIKEVSRILVENFGGKVPDSLEKLLSLPGIGRKTANCVLVYAFNKPAIPVDTHVHRISNRIGLVRTKNHFETELELKKIIPKEHWIRINNLLVSFGQSICKPVSPKCYECSIRSSCEFYKANA